MLSQVDKQIVFEVAYLRILLGLQGKKKKYRKLFDSVSIHDSSKTKHSAVVRSVKVVGRGPISIDCKSIRLFRDARLTVTFHGIPSIQKFSDV